MDLFKQMDPEVAAVLAGLPVLDLADPDGNQVSLWS